MSVSAFLKSKVFLKHLGFAIGITIVLLTLLMFLLRIYTGHGDAVEVPNFKGLSKEAAASLAEDKGLRVEFYDSVYHKGVQPGTIVGQLPQSGYKVKKNRTIYLVFASSRAEMIQMPNLKDISLRQAMALLESYGFVLGPIEYRASEYVNLVLDQKIDGRPVPVGERIPKGSTVSLVVGQGLGNKDIVIPNLVGLDLNLAKAILSDSLLNAGVVIYDKSILTEEDKLRAKIWKQKPAADDGSILKAGSSIDFWLTVDENKLKGAESAGGTTPEGEGL
ncbi:MAG: PASTA domain-containing protein [Bacteroidota bacterium]|nr:PASTA domain-containing protein [Bacteroidota bacterium]